MSILKALISIVVGSTTYSYQGAAVDNSDVKVSPVGITGWKLWMKNSGTITFNRLPTNVDICAVGKGTGGGYYRYVNKEDLGCGGGTGGKIENVTGVSLTTGTAYSVTVSSSGTSFGSIISVGQGGGAVGGNGASMYWSYSGPGGGNSGKYAFDDQNFDGVEYGHGGAGGDVNAGSGARGSTTGVYANPGAGGAGGGQSNNNPTGGNVGILIMRNAS